MQQVTSRPWITTGVALVGASMIAAAPVAAPPPTLHAVEIPDVQLTAFDPITPWIDVFSGPNGAISNATNLFGAWSSAPFPIAQQLLVNQVHNVEELLSGNVTGVFNNISDHLQGALAAPFAADLNLLTAGDGVATLTGCIIIVGCGTHTLPFSGHQEIFQLFQTLSGNNSLLDFTASPLSGLLLGAAGPVLGPGIALVDDVQAAFGALGTDPVTALNDLVNIPANMTNAFLNGGESISALPLLSLLGIPTSIDFTVGSVGITHLGLITGGLLSPGGSLFNALDFGAGGSLDLGVISGSADWLLPGHGVGPLGALVSMTQAIAQGIGWDGTGNPIGDLFGALPLGATDPGALTGGFGDVAASLSALGGQLPAELAGLLGGLDLPGGLGIDALGPLVLNIPELLLSMLTTL